MTQEYTKTVELSFLRSQLLYDIKNYAYVEGDIIEPDNIAVRHHVQGIGEDGNIDRVTRMLDLVFAWCVEILYPFTKAEVTVPALDDTLTETATYKITMHVPDEFSQTTANLLEKYIHELLVYKVLADWMSICNLANPNSSVLWAAKAQDAKEQIENSLKRRMHGVRRTMRPF